LPVATLLTSHHATNQPPRQIGSGDAQRKNNERDIAGIKSDDSRNQTARHAPACRKRAIVPRLLTKACHCRINSAIGRCVGAANENVAVNDALGYICPLSIAAITKCKFDARRVCNYQSFPLLEINK
jgi:hypothetical protein